MGLFGPRSQMENGALPPSRIKDLLRRQMQTDDTDDLPRALQSADSDPRGAQSAWARSVARTAGVPVNQEVKLVAAIRKAAPWLPLPDATSIVKGLR